MQYYCALGLQWNYGVPKTTVCGTAPATAEYFALRDSKNPRQNLDSFERFLECRARAICKGANYGFVVSYRVFSTCSWGRAGNSRSFALLPELPFTVTQAMSALEIEAGINR